MVGKFLNVITKYNVEPIEKYINASVFRIFLLMIIFGRKKSIRRDLRWVVGEDWQMNPSLFLKIFKFKISIGILEHGINDR